MSVDWQWYSPDGGSINVTDTFGDATIVVSMLFDLGGGPAVAETVLPTDPVEVEKLVAAILNATDCRLDRLIFPEDAVKGMHGMTVVKR